MTAALSAALIEQGKPFAYFIQMDWAGTIERFWTGFGNFDWQNPDDSESRIWFGTGVFGKMNIPQESGEVQVSEMTFEMSGVDGDIEDSSGVSIRDRINEDIRGGAVTVWLVFLKSDFTVDVSSQIRAGVLDRAIFEDDGGNSLVRVYARADFPFLSTQVILRWTPEQQIAALNSLAIDPATDTGFDLVHKQRDNIVAWLPG